MIYLTKNENGCGDIEFNINREGLDLNQDATVNWQTEEIRNLGIFYTDSNGLEFIKRVKKTAFESSDIKSLAPANFYPINTAIFIESSDKSKQMIVMNDRS